MGIFDHCNLTSMQVFESFQVPFCRYGYRFCQGAVCGCIQVVLRLANRYYGIDNLLAGS